MPSTSRSVGHARLESPRIHVGSTKRPRLTIAVVGAGYVGLVTSAALAALGHVVTCIDNNRERIAALRSGVNPIHEPGLDDLIFEGLATGGLRFSTDLERSTDACDIAFIAVGTLDGTGRWTDRHVRSVIEALLLQDTLPERLVVRSTLRPGQMRQLAALVEHSGRPTELLLNPEFTKEGTAVGDFLRPDRIVVGIRPGASEAVADSLRDVYAGVSAPFLVVDHASAELIKIGSNAFLATKVMFANELARFARATGADMASVREGLGLDRRIGGEFLKPGPGVGGSCLPSQVALLSDMAAGLGIPAGLIGAVRSANDAQPRLIVDELLARGSVARVGLLGLAFKAGTDDLRESPALRLADRLTAQGVFVRAHDPVVEALPDHPTVELARDPYEAATGTDALLIATEWQEYRDLNWAMLGTLMNRRLVYDTRGVIDVAQALAAGFTVLSLERSEARSSEPMAQVLALAALEPEPVGGMADQEQFAFADLEAIGAS